MNAQGISIRYTIASVILATALFAAQLCAQSASELLRYGELVYAEAVNLPPGTPAANRVQIYIRISYDFMVFVKNERASPDSLFSSGAEVSIDVKKQNGEFAASTTERISVATGEYESTNTRDKFVLIQQSFSLDTGRYLFTIEIRDKHSTRTKAQTLPISVRPLSSGEGFTIGDIIPVKTAGAGFEALGYGGKLLFNNPALFAVAVSSVSNTSWTLRVDRILETGKERIVNKTLAPSSVLTGITAPVQNGVVSQFALSGVPSVKGGILVFDSGLDSLPPGDYFFTLTGSNGIESDTISQPVGVFWKDMPLSLYDVVFATELMRYILTDDDYDEITSGSIPERRRKLQTYWKRQDPTPDTPYNERMFEYFRRVDQAYYRFQTTKQMNGALTDRGKVFILFGEPEEIRRDLVPGEAAEEIWKYPSLNKTFRFVDEERSSNYRLVN